MLETKFSDQSLPSSPSEVGDFNGDGKKEFVVNGMIHAFSSRPARKKT